MPLPHLRLFHIEHIRKPGLAYLLPEHSGLTTYVVTLFEIFFGFQKSESAANTGNNDSAKTADPVLQG
jgi:hypothetical protein